MNVGMSVAIGIDLGTTNTVVAVVVDGVAVTLEDEHERRLIPSVVSFHPSGNVLVGELARERRIVDPENTVYSVKRLIGRTWNSPEVQEARLRFPFELKSGPKDSTMVTSRGNAYALPEISAFVLRRAKKVAEEALGEKVDRAVITVPANFNELQRASTKVAGRLAGLEVLRIINEPTAAALAYGQSIRDAARVVVFDLGGGTFDVTLLDLTRDVFEVLSTAGDTSLGGDDVDTKLAEHLSDQYLKQHRYDPRAHAVEFARLRLLAEEIKCDLSSEKEIHRRIDTVGYGVDGARLVLDLALSRDELERLSGPLVDRTIQVTKGALDAAGLLPRDIDQVILVGGSTRMPVIGASVATLFGKPPTQRINPDEAVALGAAIQANALNKDKGRRPNVVLSPEKSQRTAVGLGDRQRTDVGLGIIPETGGVQGAIALPVVDGGPPKSVQSRETRPAMPAVSANPRPAAAAPRPTAMQVKETRPAMPAVTAPVGPADDRRSRLPVSPGSYSQTTPPVEEITTPMHPGPHGAAQKTQMMGAMSLPVVGDAATPAQTPSLTARGVPPPLPARANKAPEPPVEGPSFALPRRAPTLSFDEMSDPEDHAPGRTVPQAPDLDLPGTSGSASGPRPIDSFGSVAARAPERRGPGSIAGVPLDALELAPGQEPIVPEQPAPPGARVLSAHKDSVVATRGSAALLIDVTPLSLRVETVGGYSDVLITSNSPVPCDRTRVFLTAQDNQTRVTVRVAQGESARFAENTYLGEVELTGIRGASRGEVRIAVTFELDADGILNVRAREEGSKREATATLKLLGTSNDDADMDRMMARQQERQVVG